MTTPDPAAVTAAELVAMIDQYGTLQTDHGRTARIAHEDPANMPPGRAAVDIETESTNLRYDLGLILVHLHDADPAADDTDLRELVGLLDGWAFGLWHASWRDAAAEHISGAGDVASYRTHFADPTRGELVWRIEQLITNRDKRTAAP